MPPPVWPTASSRVALLLSLIHIYGWEDLTIRENAGWEAIGYTLGPGDTMALTCGFSLFEETPEAGEYRLVKEVGGSTLYAEFSLGESLSLIHISRRPLVR